MPGPGCVWRWAIPPSGKSTRSQRTTHSANGSSWTNRESSAPSASALVVVELPDERRALDGRGAEAGAPAVDVVDDAVAADRLDPGLEW